MIANRDLDLDDYLAIFRRRLKLILVTSLSAAAAGFLISFHFSPRFMSRSLVQVEKQTIPAGYVRPILTTSAIDRIATLRQQVLSRSRLEPLVNNLGLARNGRSLQDVVDEIQSNTSITEADPAGSGPSGLRGADFHGFYVSFTADNPQEAQQVCREITSMLLADNLKMREQVAVSTTDFLSRQLAEAKSNLDDKDKELAVFESRYLGQLPGDVENNLRILSGLNSELDANTQSLNRAQQDKAHAEVLLAQQITEWKSSQTLQTSETIEQKLIALQTQLIALQTRYTDDYPEVIKMKSDIAALKAKEKETSASDPPDAASDTMANKPEPAGIRQLRQQIYQNEGVIARGIEQEKRLQTAIDSYRSRLTLSPQVEEEFKKLTRDNEVAHRVYDSLLLNKSESEIQADLERRAQGEQMHMLDDASLPDSPSFPVRWKFAAGGFGAGLAFALAVSFWLELRDKAIRDERDVVAALEMPMLTSIPWVSPAATKEPAGVGGRLGLFPDR